MKYLNWFFLTVASLVVILGIKQYLFCPQFDFYASLPFKGTKWYNPYAETKQGNWIKCNFHAHSNAWNSITNGHGNASDICKTYEDMGYDISCVSDYQKINADLSTRKNYIPAYEHGYNISKTHQLVIGAQTVTWLDYIFPQTTSNKQRILDKLSEDGKAVVVLNHPELRNGYMKEEIAELQNFDCIEVLNPSARSFKIWDAVLSKGKPVFITANDDLHNVYDPNQSGILFTMLNCAASNEASVIAALKTGKGYAVHTGVDGKDIATRKHKIRESLPFLEDLSINKDTLAVAVSNKASKIEFVG